MGDLASVFESLLDIPEAERVLRLQAQAMHPEDRLLLQRMLDVDARDAPRFLDQPAVQHAQVLREEQEAHVPPESLVGQQFGAFRLERLVGQGGMATVFQARRVGADFEQTVAVKLLRRGLFSAVEQKLFLRERRLLANLSHPYIARMIDGGVTQAGVPYLVLEYVRGLRLDEYVARRRLDLRARLELFARVASAVEAAHQALIVHRDLKPSNVLVTADGTPKLLDFGVAKLLDEDASHQTLTTAMTPSYAAPEQLSGAPITTAADVYALGVILHELITGRRPRGPDASPVSTSMAGAGDASPRPETPAQLSRLMRGDLDNIVRRALEEQPSRRYASAAALVDDVHRYLQGRPVRAHAPSRWYVFRKFVRRNRVAAGLTLALVTAVAASVSGALWQARIAQREAARANAEIRFIAGLFDPLRTGVQEGEAPTIRQLLDAGVAQLNVQFGADDAALADLALLFSRVHIEIGAPDVAHELAGRAVAHARAAWGERDPRTWVALARRGEAAYHLDRYAKAVSDLEQAIAAMREGGMRGDDYAFALQDLGLAQAKVGRAADAVAAQQAAYEVLAEGGDRIELATVMNNLGGAHLAAGDAAQSLVWRQRAYDWHVAHGLGENRAALIVLGNLARVKYGLGLWREALGDLEHLLPLRARLEGGQLKRWTTTAQACSTASALWELGKAEAWCTQALAEAEQDASPLRPRAIMLDFRGGLRVRQGRFAEARADFAQSRRLFASIEGDHADFLRGIALDEAEMLRVSGDARAFAEALAQVLPTAADEKKQAALSAMLLARFAQACAEADAAPAACNDAVAARAQALVATLAPTHPYRLPAITALAARSLQVGDRADLRAGLQDAIADATPMLGAQHPWIGEAQVVLARAADVAGDARIAQAARADAARIAQRLAPGHPLRARLSLR